MESRSIWTRVTRGVRYHTIRLFRIRESSAKIARGFALGLTVNFFPTFGFGVLISGFFARALGGSAVAGLAGGAMLTFAWPVLFYLNMRVGSLFTRPPIRVDEMADVTERNIDALVWGHTFLVGAVINSLVVAVLAYTVIRLIYSRVRPKVLSRLRQRARYRKSRSSTMAPRQVLAGEGTRSSQGL